MSEYQDYQFSQQDFYEEFSMLNSPCFDERNPLQAYFFIDKEASKELPPTLDLFNPTEMKSAIDKQTHMEVESLPSNQKRSKRMIKIDEETKSKRKVIFKGLKDDTTELNSNFKTILSKKFKQLTLLKEVQPYETNLIQQFVKSGPSFTNIKILCKSQKLKKKGLEFIKSPSLILQILRSKVQMENKMTMIKYIECLRENFATNEITKWKNIIFE